MRMRRRIRCILDICFIFLIAGSITLGMNFGKFPEGLESLGDNSSQSPHTAIAECTFDQITEINDDTVGQSWGDNDREVDAGETIEMKLSLRNDGADDATNVNATLGAINPLDNNITFVVVKQAFGTIPFGANGTSLGYFIFKINETCSGYYSIGISLDIEADGGLFWNDIFVITVKGNIYLSFSSFTVISESDGDRVADNDSVIDQGENFSLGINETANYDIISFNMHPIARHGDGDQDLDGGELWYPSITIRNNGTALGSSVVVTFSSPDPYFSYSESWSQSPDNHRLPFGTIQVGASATAVYDNDFWFWQFKISHNVPAGHIMVFQVSITDEANAIGWIYNITRTIVSASFLPTPPGDAGYPTDAGNSTNTALFLNLEQAYTCYIPGNDPVDYFAIVVPSFHPSLWIIISGGCHTCYHHNATFYNSDGISLSPSGGSSNVYHYDLSNQLVGIYYISVSGHPSDFGGWDQYSIKVTFTDPDPPVWQNISLVLLCVLGIISGVVAIAHFAKPEKRKKVREWCRTVKKRWSSLGNTRSSNSSSPSRSPETTTTVQER